MQTLWLLSCLTFHFLSARHYRKLSRASGRLLSENISGKPDAFYHDTMGELDRALKLGDWHLSQYSRTLILLRGLLDG